jgi:hypothetical protein
MSDLTLSFQWQWQWCMDVALYCEARVKQLCNDHAHLSSGAKASACMHLIGTYITLMISCVVVCLVIHSYFIDFVS